MNTTEQSITLNREIFAWCVRQAAKWLKKEPERAALWCSLAAHTATLFGCSVLASLELEAELARLGRRLTTPPAPANHLNRRWLHVFSMVYPVGGHTALVERWLKSDKSADQHHALLTSQETVDFAPRLNDAIQIKNGRVTALTQHASLLERAQQLRDIAWQEADVVVLHTHMWDVLPTIAFSLPGGPPVLLLNHADHCFWVGGSVSDMVINIRESGRQLAEQYRGLNSHIELPVPLPDFLGATNLAEEKHRKKTQALTRLGLAPNLIVFLTVGSGFKYEPTESANFFEAAQAILERVPDSCLIAIGPSSKNERWQALYQNTQGRAIAVGQQTNLHPFHLAADIYLEGFPFGSLTALLEAGLAGLASVRAPQTCPSPFVADGAALENLARPLNSNGYIDLAVQLAENKNQRNHMAMTLAQGINQHHCGTGWQIYLESLIAGLPSTHRGFIPFTSKPLDHQRNHFWHQLLMSAATEDPLSYVFDEAKRNHLRPAVDSKLWKAMQEAQRQ